MHGCEAATDVPAARAAFSQTKGSARPSAIRVSPTSRQCREPVRHRRFGIRYRELVCTSKKSLSKVRARLGVDDLRL